MSIWLPVSLVSVLTLQATPAPVVDTPFPLAGTWRLDPERSQSAADGGASSIVVEIAKQDESVRIATIRGEQRREAVYTLTSRPPSNLGVDGFASRAYWDGTSLITEGTRSIQGQTVNVRETRRLRADGAEMEVEVVVMVQHGYEFRGARNYGTGRDIYVRVK